MQTELRRTHACRILNSIRSLTESRTETGGKYSSKASGAGRPEPLAEDSNAVQFQGKTSDLSIISHEQFKRVYRYACDKPTSQQQQLSDTEALRLWMQHSEGWEYKKPAPQIRSGGRKGMGGRPMGTRPNVSENFRPLPHCIILSRLICLDACNNIHLQDFFRSYQLENMRGRNKNVLKPVFKPYISSLQGILLGTAVKIPAGDYRKEQVPDNTDTENSDSDGEDYFMASALKHGARSRHPICTWIDLQGTVRC